MNDFKQFITELALKSGEIINGYFSSLSLTVEYKSDNTEVTIADKKAEEIIRELIQKHYPTHGIIGEEHGTEHGDAEYVWSIDPIDGTRAFVHQVPLFTTLIALLKNGAPILGCIHQPTLKKMMIGDGTLTTLNGVPVQVRKSTTQIADASVLASSVQGIEGYFPREGFDRLVHSAKVFRTWGDGYGYMLLASGKADVMIDAIVNPWDVLPLIPVVEGAGGTITGWNGKSALESMSVVATNGLVHDKVLSLLGCAKT